MTPPPSDDTMGLGESANSHTGSTRSVQTTASSRARHRVIALQIEATMRAAQEKLDDEAAAQQEADEQQRAEAAAIALATSQKLARDSRARERDLQRRRDDLKAHTELKVAEAIATHEEEAEEAHRKLIGAGVVVDMSGGSHLHQTPTAAEVPMTTEHLLVSRQDVSKPSLDDNSPGENPYRPPPMVQSLQLRYRDQSQPTHTASRQEPPALREPPYLASRAEPQASTGQSRENAISRDPPRASRQPSPARSTVSSRTVEDTMEALLLQNRELMGAMQAPKVSLKGFDGNPMCYYPFIRQFQENMEKKIPDPASRLAQLTQCCTGEAARVLECCQLMHARDGYPRAMQLLKDRFGDTYTISNLWIKRLVDDSKRRGLREYADELRSCYGALEAVGSSQELNTQGNILRLVQKLPSYLVNRWRGQVQTIKRQGRQPSLRDLVQFTESAADEACDPVYGNQHAQGQDPPSRASRPERKSSNYSTAIQEPCYVCGGGHNVSTCPQFKKMGLEERDAWRTGGRPGGGRNKCMQVDCRTVQRAPLPKQWLTCGEAVMKTRT